MLQRSINQRYPPRVYIIPTERHRARWYTRRQIIHKLYVMLPENTDIDSQLPNKGQKPTLATTLPGTLQYTGPLYGLLTT